MSRHLEVFQDCLAADLTSQAPPPPPPYAAADLKPDRQPGTSWNRLELTLLSPYGLAF